MNEKITGIHRYRFLFHAEQLQTNPPPAGNFLFPPPKIGRTVLILCLLLFLLLLPGCRGEKNVKIGAVISLTGAISSMQDVRDGMLLATEEINEQGGIGGAMIDLRIEDSESDPATGKRKMRQLAEDFNPLLLVSTTSSVSVAAAQVAEEYEIPMVGLVATDPFLTVDTEWVYSFFPDAEQEVQPIINILKQKGIDDLGVLYQEDAYGESIYRTMSAVCRQEGIECEFVPYSIGDSALSDKTDRLLEKAAIYAVGFGSDLARIYSYVEEQEYTGLKIGPSTISHPNFRERPEAHGLYCAAPLMYNENHIFAREVKTRYEKRYNRIFSHYAGTGYDFIKIAAGLLEEEELTHQSVRAIFNEGFIYPGLFGQISLEEGERIIHFPLYAAQIIDGKLLFSR